MYRKIKIEVIIVLSLFLSSTVLLGKTKNDLVTRFADILKFRSYSTNEHKSQLDTKITALFVRSSLQNSIDLTMLITFDKGITAATRKITNNAVTPLIFSVSTMPFVEIEFDPTYFIFEQAGIRWSPSSNDSEFDFFPLGEDVDFGGEIREQDIHQGVIMLPDNFDINRPIKISYKQFNKICKLR